MPQGFDDSNTYPIPYLNIALTNLCSSTQGLYKHNRNIPRRKRCAVAAFSSEGLIYPLNSIFCLDLCSVEIVYAALLCVIHHYIKQVKIAFAANLVHLFMLQMLKTRNIDKKSAAVGTSFAFLDGRKAVYVHSYRNVTNPHYTLFVAHYNMVCSAVSPACIVHSALYKYNAL